MLAPHDRGLSCLLIGDVPDDLAEPSKRTGVIAQRRDRHAGEKFRSVLADAPAFFLDPTETVGVFEVGARLARGHVFGSIEDREIATDDVRLRPALDPFGPAVPDRDAAHWVQHVDRVIGRTVDQQAQFLGHRGMAPRNRVGGCPIGWGPRNVHAGGAVALGARGRCIGTLALCRGVARTGGRRSARDVQLPDMTHVRPMVADKPATLRPVRSAPACLRPP